MFPKSEVIVISPDPVWLKIRVPRVTLFPPLISILPDAEALIVVLSCILMAPVACITKLLAVGTVVILLLPPRVMAPP
jgi:hypothetical protein